MLLSNSTCLTCMARHVICLSALWSTWLACVVLPQHLLVHCSVAAAPAVWRQKDGRVNDVPVPHPPTEPVWVVGPGESPDGRPSKIPCYSREIPSGYCRGWRGPSAAQPRTDSRPVPRPPRPLLLLLAGDIETNPGPYPCPTCSRPYTRRMGSIQCPCCNNNNKGADE